MDENTVLLTSETQELALKLRKELDARIYIYNGLISEEGMTNLILCDEEENGPPNTLLILVTYGGWANAAYKIARYLQDTSDIFYLSVPSYCKSAGTLLALGAHEIFMDTVSELGPLDVQLLQRDEIGRRRSGMVIKTAFEGLADECVKLFENVLFNIKNNSRDNISFETASRIASDIVNGVMPSVYSQISPDSLGSDLRDLRIAQAYGERLSEISGNPKPGAVSHLVSRYPSHDFIIDRDEADELFEHVKDTPEGLHDLIKLLPNCYEMQVPPVIRRLDLPPSNPLHEVPHEENEEK